MGEVNVEVQLFREVVDGVFHAINIPHPRKKSTSFFIETEKSFRALPRALAPSLAPSRARPRARARALKSGA